MNDLLADWYAEVAVDLGAESLAARGRALDTVVADVTRGQLVELVAVAHERPGAAESAEWFRKAVKEEDPGFRMRQNERETALLAAACLWDLVDRRDALAILAGYATAVAACRGWSCILPELPVRAEERLASLGADERGLAARPQVGKPAVWTKSLVATVKTSLGITEGSAPTPATTAQVETAIARGMTAVQTALGQVVTDIERVGDWAEQAVDVATEEGALVGWLLSGWSTTARRPWAELSAPTAAVLAARELADLVTLLPAPPHADPLLAQLLAATPFTGTVEDGDVPGLAAPQELEVLLDNLPTADTDPVPLARHSLRQAMLMRAWDAA